MLVLEDRILLLESLLLQQLFDHFLAYFRHHPIYLKKAMPFVMTLKGVYIGLNVYVIVGPFGSGFTWGMTKN